jgi:transposase
MGTVRTDEFRKDAVRIAFTSGLSRRQVADDLGVGMSTLNKWVTAHRETDVVSTEDRELARENERLRREIRILKEERDILKKPPSSSQVKSREVQVCQRTARGFPGRPAVSGDECQPPQVAGLPQPTCQPQAAHGHGGSGAHQGAVASEPGQPLPPKDDRRTEGSRCRCGAPAGWTADAGERDRR